MSEPNPKAKSLELEHVDVDVESLGDGRWSRIERGLFARLDQAPASPAVKPARAWRGLAFGSLAVAAAAGAVAVARVVARVPSQEPARIVTTASASRFTIGESSLLIAPSSVVLVSGDDDRGIDVVLDRGSVTCEVAPRHGRPPFVVDAGEVRVQVVGTKFTVARSVAETSVGVEHGVVQVAAAGMVTVLHDGERWPSPPQAAPSSPYLPLPATPTPTPTPIEAAPEAPAEAPSAPRASHSHPAMPGPGSQTADTSKGEGTSAKAMDSTKRESTPAAMGPSPAAAPSPQTAAQPSPQDLFESAARIERSRPADAAAIYRQLVDGHTGWSESALFALGRLEADRGHQGDARQWLELYLARYPRGINADDARALLRRMP